MTKDMTKKVAVTGASGFIGTEVLHRLEDRNNIEIIALTRSFADKHDKYEWRSTDYSYESLCSALEGADAIIHLAGVRGTTSNPDDYIINEKITGNILSAMSADKISRIIFASTISVYDDENLIPWTEGAPLRGRTAYGNSKVVCERLIREYSDKSGIEYAIVRIAQVLGEGERRRGMMNVFLDTAAAGGQLRVIGESRAKRQYIYIRDLADILVALSDIKYDKETDGNNENKQKVGAGLALTLNAGMPSAYSNLEIAEIVNRIYENTTPIDYDDSIHETIRSSWMDISRLRDVLRTEPMDMESAIKDMRSRRI